MSPIPEISSLVIRLRDLYPPSLKLHYSVGGSLFHSRLLSAILKVPSHWERFYNLGQLLDDLSWTFMILKVFVRKQSPCGHMANVCSVEKELHWSGGNLFWNCLQGGSTSIWSGIALSGWGGVTPPYVRGDVRSPHLAFCRVLAVLAARKSQ